MLNTYFGGTLTQDLESERQIFHPYHSNHLVKTEKGGWFWKTFGPSFYVNSYHHQAIDSLGKDLIPTSYTTDKQIIESIEHCTLPIRAVQWHPERMFGDNRFDVQGPDMAPYFKEFCRLCVQGGT